MASKAQDVELPLSDSPSLTIAPRKRPSEPSWDANFSENIALLDSWCEAVDNCTELPLTLIEVSRLLEDMVALIESRPVGPELDPYKVALNKVGSKCLIAIMTGDQFWTP
jgi:hypothetical protein